MGRGSGQGFAATRRAWTPKTDELRLRCVPLPCSFGTTTPWKTNMEPESPWLVEENSLPWVYVSFRECISIQNTTPYHRAATRPHRIARDHSWQVGQRFQVETDLKGWEHATLRRSMAPPFPRRFRSQSMERVDNWSGP